MSLKVVLGLLVVSTFAALVLADGDKDFVKIGVTVNEINFLLTSLVPT